MNLPSIVLVGGARQGLLAHSLYYHGTELNNLCWVTEISQRQVAFVAIMRPPRPNLKIKHEINYGIESFYSRGAGKLKLCLVKIIKCYYNNT